MLKLNTAVIVSNSGIFEDAKNYPVGIVYGTETTAYGSFYNVRLLTRTDPFCYVRVQSHMVEALEDYHSGNLPHVGQRIRCLTRDIEGHVESIRCWRRGKVVSIKTPIGTFRPEDIAPCN